MSAGAWAQTKPCEACPYRKDAPRGIWSAEEFRNLEAQDRNQYGGSTFGCHLGAGKPAAERQPCAGWLIDQKRRGVPSIQLRMVIITNPDAAALFARIDENTVGLYPSIAAMVKANVGRAFPRRSAKAQRLAEKIRRA